MAKPSAHRPIEATAIGPHRRRLLLRMGLASLVTYAAPTVLHLGGQAHASDDRGRDFVRSDDRSDGRRRRRSDDRVDLDGPRERED